MVNIYFKCINPDCPERDEEIHQKTMRFRIDKQTGDVIYDNVECPVCGEKREVIKKKKGTGYTTHMIGKNIGKG